MRDRKVAPWHVLSVSRSPSCFSAQVGLHSIIQFETGIKRVAEQEQSKWQFEEEIKALGAEEVQAEFSGYFASIVRDITLHTLVSASRNI